MKKFSDHAKAKPTPFSFTVKLSFDESTNESIDSTLSITTEGVTETEAKEKVSKTLEKHQIKFEFVNA